MTGEDKAREVAEKLRKENDEAKVEEKKETEQAIQTLAERKQAIASMYSGDQNVGTEEVDAEDLNVPSLKLVQGIKRPLLANGQKAEEGYWYRTDTREQAPEYDVTLLVFRKTMGENFKKNGLERKHIYFGVYAGTVEPFRMYCRGWSLSGSRAFLTEAKRYQAKFKIPMFALTVKMKSAPQSGKTEDNADYTINSAVFEIVKDAEGNPVVETDQARVEVLREFVDRFMTINVEGSDEDSDVQNEKLNKEPVTAAKTAEDVNPSDIPF